MHYIYRALNFYYYYISSTSAHQALNPRGWGPLSYRMFPVAGVPSQFAISSLHNLCSAHARIGEGNGTPLRYSCLGNPMDGGAWWAAVPGVAKGRTRLGDFTFTFHHHALEKEMATHSSVLAWRIPGKGEPGGLLSMRSHRVGHD